MILYFSKFNKHFILRILYLTIFAIISGIATFLGLGTMEINSGFSSYGNLNSLLL
ncbi:hypothetical protein GCM10008917_15170 [Paraclostridium tenue]|uniref:ABC transporter permease n=1 Tax=Paraclostridium tenue TaxID=1737 RepID=A0ABP3XFE9_9FIRM